MHETYKYNTPS